MTEAQLKADGGTKVSEALYSYKNLIYVKEDGGIYELDCCPGL